MFSAARTSLASTSRLSLRNSRTYVAGPEPVNIQRGNSRTPFYIVAALGALGLGYSLSAKSGPETSASKRMEKEALPKTDAAKEARNAGAVEVKK